MTPVDSGIRFSGESEEYRRERNRLLEAEAGLRRAIEAVAAQRRALPLGGVVANDYRFEEASDGREVRFSDLFEAGKDSLVIYSFMFPRYSGDTSRGPVEGETARLPLSETPCASCTSILDSLDGAAQHLSRRLNLAVVAKSDPDRIRNFGRERGWRHLRVPSSAKQRLQPRPPGGDARRRADADTERVRPRWRPVPSHVGLGADVRAARRTAGGPPRRLHLADLECAGCHAGRPRRRAELPGAALRVSSAKGTVRAGGELPDPRDDAETGTIVGGSDRCLLVLALVGGRGRCYCARAFAGVVPARAICCAVRMNAATTGRRPC